MSEVDANACGSELSIRAIRSHVPRPPTPVPCCRAQGVRLSPVRHGVMRKDVRRERRIRGYSRLNNDLIDAPPCGTVMAGQREIWRQS